MAKVAKILLPLPFNREFDYLMDAAHEIHEGNYAYVPFGNKKLWGVVTQIKQKKESSFKGKLKSIISTAKLDNVDIPPFPEKLLELIEWQANYTMEEKGKVLSLCYNGKFFKQPKRVIKPKDSGKKIKKHSPKKLSKAQQSVYDDIKKDINEHDFSAHLLDGITGSGKTEIYFHLIEDTLNKGKQALIMFPEILLTSQMMQRFEQRFGFSPTLWHSGITEAQKRNNFLSIARGDAKIIIGARSALHLPYKELGLIILDEEHDASYKQEEQVIYNARDIAVIRAKIEAIPIILCSATPSIETYYNALSGKYFHHKLPVRFNDNELPDIKMIDMRKEKLPAKNFISKELKEEIEKNLKENKQTLLFLNRKGYAPLLLCDKCGFRFKSPDTSAWMVLHYDNLRNPYLECHHSGVTMKLPKHCPKCEAENSFRACGPGIQRIEEEVASLFPDAKIMQIAKDSFSDTKKAHDVINKIQKGEVDIIIGTQIIAKGYHFPALKLVGVIDGDLGLDFSDLRASERTFQLLQQVSGRAGREGSKGKVLIQTYQPENEVFAYLKNNDKENFISFELGERKLAKLPPYSRLTAIIIESKDEKKSNQFAKEVTAALSGAKEVEIYGPAKAMYYELRGFFRNRILLKTEKNINIQKFLRDRLEKIKTPANVKLKIDIDPYSFS